MTAATLHRGVTTRGSARGPVQTLRDEQTAHWSRSGSVTVARSALLAYAQNRIVELTNLKRGWDGMDAEPVSKKRASLAVSILNLIVFENDLATPQAMPERDGGITVEWLVSGDHMGFSVHPDCISIWGEYANGSDAFEPYFYDGTTDPDTAEVLFEGAVKDAMTFLAKMSAGVNYRLSLK